MKNLAFITLFLISATAILAQEFLTIGEVFDFEIDDEFQIAGYADGQTPNADRIKIIDKYYANDSSTVYYVQFHDSYYTYIENEELHYHFWTKTDTISYTNLNSSLTIYHDWTNYDTAMIYYDTIIEMSENYCDSILNGYQYAENDFEPVYHSNIFGKGLGMVKNYFYEPAEYSMFDNELFFYKKNGESCGTPDSSTVSVAEIKTSDNFIISPNPTKEKVTVSLNVKKNFSGKIIIVSLSGAFVFEKLVHNKSEILINLTNFKSGFYLIQLSNKNGEIVGNEKLIIE